ncbi:PAAR domain-containing protein [Burkholderia multivorans]|uniref:PAAR domain-containing protein n=1 Tax=Burkholderia multivorans TaxID=87883 RepID=UPI001E5010C8|nr:PAAR domain-containing protein [Burkholderia multivorans]MCA8454574.1 PAAR domain-containing protein [Burkholderia multivorans]MDN7871453.1 PAAR domain-containing protein [Burkholderia multivorans]MDN7964035.1 PAAR domain-containing protein [Burkholderia multivorans]
MYLLVCASLRVNISLVLQGRSPDFCAVRERRHAIDLFANLSKDPTMSRRVVRNGDPTTTGGFVTATTATIFHKGKHVALNGDEATCGNCKGSFMIVGSATRVTWHGRNVVLEGDRVLCPCGMNTVLAGSDCTIFYDVSDGAAGIGTRSSSALMHSVTSVVHDEQFVIRDKRTKKPLSNVQYWIKDQFGNVLASGSSDARGCTLRVRTEGPQTLKLFVGD